MKVGTSAMTNDTTQTSIPSVSEAAELAEVNLISYCLAYQSYVLTVSIFAYFQYQVFVLASARPLAVA